MPFASKIVLATINLVVLYFLPETRDLQLPDTVTEKKEQIEMQAAAADQRRGSSVKRSQ